MAPENNFINSKLTFTIRRLSYDENNDTSLCPVFKKTSLIVYSLTEVIPIIHDKASWGGGKRWTLLALLVLHLTHFYHCMGLVANFY